MHGQVALKQQNPLTLKGITSFRHGLSMTIKHLSKPYIDSLDGPLPNLFSHCSSDL